ncbi:MAG TPA: glycosyltransferase family 4 protein, partial [Elusimicrobiales bacterium]|nr:glycosyltransferase family 4 protein [Elusimicrobiales bacterium]
MRIAFISNFYPPIQTGSCYWAKNVAKAHLRAGDEVIVVTAGTGKDVSFAVEDGVQVYRLPTTVTLPKLGMLMNFSQFHLLYSPGNLRRLLPILEKHRVQVLHNSNHILDGALLTLAASAKLKIPAVSSIHSIISHNGNKFYDLAMKGLDKALLARLMNRFDAIISVDKPSDDYVRNTYSAKRLELIPLCSLTQEEMDKIPLARPDVLQEDGKFRIASVGHITENRNRLDLIRAIPALLKRGIKPQVDIAGKELTPLPRRLAQELGVMEYVNFIGEVNHYELFKLFSRANAELHLFFMKGIGCASLEAMASGLPVTVYGYPG